MTWCTDTPAFGLSTQLIYNILLEPGDGTYVVLLPTSSSAMPLMQKLHLSNRATCMGRHMSVQRFLPAHCTKFAHHLKSVTCQHWMVYPPKHPPQLRHEFLFIAFASVIVKYGGVMGAISPKVLPYRLQSKEGEYFSWVYQKESAVRAAKLQAAWCAKRRVIRASFSWEGVGHSYDVVNKLFHVCTSSVGRKISSWTQVVPTMSVLKRHLDLCDLGAPRYICIRGAMRREIFGATHFLAHDGAHFGRPRLAAPSQKQTQQKSFFRMDFEAWVPRDPIIASRNGPALESRPP